MTEAPAGTPTDPKESSQKAETPPAPKDDSKQVTVSEQFKKEALENWKPAAEEANRLKAELAAKNAELERLTRVALGGGHSATDPNVEAYQETLKQSEFDPVARMTVLNAQKAARAEAEAWLANELLSIPDAKRPLVAGLIRANGYQLSGTDALKLVTDPESETLAQRLAEKEKEIERLKNAKPNGVSPATVTPANTDADDGRTEESIERADYVAALQRASAEGATEEDKARARALMKATGSNKTKLKN